MDEDKTLCTAKENDYIRFLNSLIINSSFDSNSLHLIVTHGKYLRNYIIPSLDKKNKSKNLQAFYVTYLIYEDNTIVSVVNKTFKKDIQQLTQEQQSNLVNQAVVKKMLGSVFLNCKYDSKKVVKAVARM